MDPRSKLKDKSSSKAPNATTEFGIPTEGFSCWFVSELFEIGVKHLLKKIYNLQAEIEVPSQIS